jgi:hypothetical protein
LLQQRQQVHSAVATLLQLWQQVLSLLLLLLLLEASFAAMAEAIAVHGASQYINCDRPGMSKPSLPIVAPSLPHPRHYFVFCLI